MSTIQFERYSSVETIELEPGLYRVFMRPNAAELQALYKSFDLQTHGHSLLSTAGLILRAAFDQLKQEALRLSHTGGKFDVYIESNSENDGLDLGGATLDINSPQMTRVVENWHNFITSEHMPFFFMGSVKSFYATSKSILVNAYLRPKLISDHVLLPYEGLNEKCVSLLQEEHDKRKVAHLTAQFKLNAPMN